MSLDLQGDGASVPLIRLHCSRLTLPVQERKIDESSGLLQYISPHRRGSARGLKTYLILRPGCLHSLRRALGSNERHKLRLHYLLPFLGDVKVSLFQNFCLPLRHTYHKSKSEGVLERVP